METSLFFSLSESVSYLHLSHLVWTVLVPDKQESFEKLWQLGFFFCNFIFDFYWDRSVDSTVDVNFNILDAKTVTWGRQQSLLVQVTYSLRRNECQLERVTRNE